MHQSRFARPLITMSIAFIAIFVLTIITSTASVAEEHDNEHVEHVEDGGVSMVTFFHDYISGPIVRLRCINCHVDGGLSGHTRVVFVRASDEADHESHNLRTFFYSLASGRKATAMRTDLNTVLNVF